jgi:hypothetical protein
MARCVSSKLRFSNFHHNKKFWEELIACFPSYDTGHIENRASNNSSIVACVFVTTVTFLPSRYLATIAGIHRQTHIHTHTRRQKRDLISLLYFLQNEESGLMMHNYLTRVGCVEQWYSTRGTGTLGGRRYLRGYVK